MQTELTAFDQRCLDKVPAIIGVDEAGRGPLAGPVCAAAVYLDQSFYSSDWLQEYAEEINDSKQLQEPARERVFDALLEEAADLVCWTCHLVSVEEIETLNILGATRKAMALCLDELKKKSNCCFEQAYEGEGWLFQSSDDPGIAQILIDGNPLKPFPYEHTAIVKGDGKSLSIALASIIAKVIRDRYMCEQAELYPEYGFVANKGYGTPGHIAAIKESGPCKLHRMSFLSHILS